MLPKPNNEINKEIIIEIQLNVLQTFSDWKLKI